MGEIVSKSDYRNAMARVCQPVNVITTEGAAGRGGFTATSMCSVSDAPPTLLVCMNSTSKQLAMFERNGQFCVNVLSEEHLELASLFAGGTSDMEERYAAAEWVDMRSGRRALAGAIVSFDCDTVEMHQVGTHVVMVGQVRDVRSRSDGTALLYFDRSYVHLPN